MTGKSITENDKHILLWRGQRSREGVTLSGSRFGYRHMFDPSTRSGARSLPCLRQPVGTADAWGFHRRPIANAQSSRDSRQARRERLGISSLISASSVRGSGPFNFKFCNSTYFLFCNEKVIWSNKMNEMTKQIKNHCTMKQVKYGTTG